MHWDTEGPQHEVQELWQAEREVVVGGGTEELTHLTFDPNSSNVRPTSASAVGVLVVVSRAVRNALSMMQGSPRSTGGTRRVVRETGGTGGVAGCEPAARQR